ncbi:LPS-assembly protein LptD [Tepidimonas alkaliphilus]|uniref:LPS-assembly protein LptD n=1 Tax=Tepidimonas alkaliphilus TaxID=2588942 RepID=A0A554W809_9BURK|nr:LPS assembly protein LptD [Tepidimonas alkaliphilus]TSE19708.1 LPS-assembly protein LptD [Tepidimonas alkaliphilus]
MLGYANLRRFLVAVLTLRAETPLRRSGRAALRPWLWIGAWAAWSGSVWSQEALLLQPSLTLQEVPPPLRRQLPLTLEGQRIHGRADEQVEVEGDALLRRHDLVLRAQRLQHTAADDTALAEGTVRVNRLGDVYEGTRLQLRLDTFEGRFDDVRFELRRTGGRGEAARVDFLDEQRSVAHQVRYSTCPRPSQGDWQPDWALRADEVRFDLAADTGEARGARLEFRGVPLLAAPWISFPLSSARKSGVLPPTFNLDNKSGFETTVPYYFNLAPNRDATLYPTLMTRRGFDLGGEFRYLEPTYAGQMRAAWMGSDRLRDRNRWAYAVQHQHALHDWDWLPGAGLRLNLNRVSDDDYWRDFPRTTVITNLAQRLLANEAVVSGGSGDWSYSLLAQRWQTLGAAPSLTAIGPEQIVAPYDRLPSLALRWRPPMGEGGLANGWLLTLDAELTQFRTARTPTVWDGISPGEQRTDVNGTRTLAVARLQRRWEAPGWFVQPSLQLHARHYRFEQPLGDGRQRASVALPTGALDAGLIFEREAQWGPRAVVQTLEPRVLLAATPFRDQRLLPVYDSAAYDFNLATIYAANPYAGHDRIADARSVTYGLTTRLYDADDGGELASLGVAQRLRLREQRVTLPNEAALATGRSDILIGATLQPASSWSFNGTWQFNTELRTSVRTLLTARYQPGPYRVLSAAYRNNETTVARSRLLDVAWQWPLAALRGPAPQPVPGQGLGPGQWYSVGRLNYSLLERRIVDLVAGFEYDAGCWIARVVLERLQQSRTSANQRILFQLEFSGFSRLGSNPLQALRQHIPRYQYLREDVNPPSRFQTYE